MESWQTLFLVAGCVHLGIMLMFDVFADARQQPWASYACSPPTESRGDIHRDKQHEGKPFSTGNGVIRISEDSEETALLTESLGGGDEDTCPMRYGATSRSTLVITPIQPPLQNMDLDC